MTNEFAGYTIILLRVKYNMSQKALARKIGVPVKVLRQWETDEEAPSHDALTKIAQVFQVKVNDILSGEIAMNNGMDLKLFKTLQ